MTGATDQRIDPYLGTVVHVVGARQARPNLPSTGCPFCVGGLEAPDRTTFVGSPIAGRRCRASVARWCCTPRSTTPRWRRSASLGVRKVIDSWAAADDRARKRDDVEFVLVFENRGPEVGATIAHPHGQIYAYDHVPHRPAALLAAGWKPEADCADRSVGQRRRLAGCVPEASTFPIAVTIAPEDQVADLPLARRRRARSTGGSAGRHVRAARPAVRAATALHDVAQPTADRRRGVAAGMVQHRDRVAVAQRRGPRFIAAAEVACGEFFNPVIPEDLARQLRELAHPPSCDLAICGCRSSD